ncbi:MAG: hypothetical protein N2Z40_00355 [Caldimicrobium sp.]|nr:hypothetical protein [Caldimicrobium sp.]MCX7612664.1 hypothetical protein [Caldimicrobium sp.]MDW8182183.1 hypothetical protein [Caldimicrobium sp.]
MILPLVMMIFLLGQVFPLLAKDYPLPPGTLLRLPKNSKIKINWLVPSSNKEISQMENLSFGVDESGEPWLGFKRKYLFNPLRRVIFTLDREFEDFIFLAGEFLLISRKALGYLVYNRDAPLRFVPLIELPTEEGKLFKGEKDRLYVLLSERSKGEYEVYRLMEKGGQGVAEKIFTTKEPIVDLCESGNILYMVSGKLILGLDTDKRDIFLHHKHRDILREIECSPDVGIFYATERRVGFIGKNKRVEFMEAKEPKILLKNDSLFILLKNHLGVLRLDHVRDFDKY